MEGIKEYSIYIIRNLVTYQVYIGQSGNVIGRIKGHKISLRLNNNHNQHMQKSYNKYGLDNFTFEVLETNITCPLVVDFKERFYIKKYDSMNPKKGYNKESGGNCNKFVSEETKKLQSNAKTGERHHYFGKFRESHPAFGNKHTEEHKNKIRKMQTGTKRSKETKNKLSEKKMGIKNPSARTIINIVSGEIFSTLNEAAISIKMNVNTLGGKLRETRKNNTNLRFKNEHNKRD